MKTLLSGAVLALVLVGFARDDRDEDGEGWYYEPMDPDSDEPLVFPVN